MNFLPFVKFAAEDGPHIAISPEVVFHIGGFEVTNSHIYAVVCSIFIGLVLYAFGKKIKLKSTGGFTQFVELGAEFVIGLLTSAMGNRKRAVKYAPLFICFFFFILFNNWLGLLPGVGPSLESNGVPVFRPFTADLNGTLALALIAIATVQYCAVKEMGGMNHLKHYFGGNFKNPINLFVGVLELFGELTRVVSLALRLFFNVLIGEILISIFTFLGKTGSPLTTLPFIGMELFVGLVQSYIFTMLCATYLGIATAHHSDDHSDHSTHPVVNSVAGETV
jgi:F-type H+-transporting ATPase subunit a